MRRTHLIHARREKGLRQEQFAEKMGVHRSTIVGWENGTQGPHPDQYPIIRDILESSDPKLFDVDIQGSVEGFKEFMEMLRRQFLDFLAKFGGTTLFGNVSLALVSSPTVEPEEYLALCSASIGTWWEWLRARNNKLESVLSENVPILARLSHTVTPYQGIAANLAVQLKIMQNQIATRNLDFVGRERLGVAAVRFGQLSGNRDLLAIAQYWHGDTFIYCYHQPQDAIPLFKEALSGLSSESSQLVRSAIYSDLSIAHAQDKDETKAKENEKLVRDYAEQARLTIPEHPELDPYYQCIGMGPSELDQFEGRAFLYLAEHFPGSNYARQAYDAFDTSTSKRAITKGYRGQALIRKADAACALGEMREFVQSLEQGLLIALEIGSQMRIIEARDLMGRIPENWQRESAIQKLKEELDHAHPVLPYRV